MNHAVILAAGIGSRLRPITLSLPKGCIPVAGRPILAHQLHAYADAGIEEVTVVAGYLPDRTRACCVSVAEEREDLTVSVVENDRYANTNNLYSLALLADRLAGEPFLLSNGDVVFDPVVVERLLASDGESAIACDETTYDEEAMKVTTDESGHVDHIAKDVARSDAHATSIDLYRFSEAFSARLFARADRVLDGAYDAWTEVAIDDLLGEFPVEPASIGGADWVEVDDGDDLQVADRTFGDVALDDYEVVFFDLDGTIYLDDTLVEGAATVVETLRRRGIDVRFLSNNSSAWKDDYAEKLTTLGIDARPEDVVLSTDGVIAYLERRDATETYVVGTDAMRGALADHGIGVDSTDPDYVVVGFDTDLTYEKVRRATLAVRDGAEFLLAHGDTVCPTAEGFIPDCGAIGALVETAADEPPTRVFGKPDPTMVDPVLSDGGYALEDVLVVGDRLETEIRLADRLGCHSVCVLTGDATRTDVATSEVQPSLVVETVGDLQQCFGADASTSGEGGESLGYTD
ncbi:HAD-IIA family hydrolase [Halomarina oriensis]|uniref:HAD-IIA family hydrolase n=1 Tax=Halomarina oriensis TaxID=671145 RepID=A0A6B0GKD3_9EURY|nr:HAD-IIA family hydrolase [Halomarina oriensis]MWG34267.1 HAD-IIA family hydrolase [Halomarina oriensis]